MDRDLIKRMAIEAIEAYASHLSDLGCDDWKWPESMPIETRVEFIRAYHEWNGSPESEEWYIAGEIERVRAGSTWWSEGCMCHALSHMMRGL